MDGTVVVVGGGQAACQFVASVRQMGYRGRLILVGDEAVLPYQRPPLSKAFLAGTVEVQGLHLRPESFYAEAVCELRLGQRLEHIDRVSKKLTLQDGTEIFYDTLVLATGARARVLPGAPTSDSRVQYLRDLVQAGELKSALVRARRVSIIGAGYVGMEVAASARRMGLEVTVLEAAHRVMQRSVGEAISAAVEGFHRSEGVVVELDCEISGIVAHNDFIEVRAAHGTIQSDLLIVGIGAVPNIEVASEAGLACERGIVVDENARTSDPAIFAIGDCTEQSHPLYGTGLRLESVANAIDQAKIAAAGVSGKPLPTVAVPWFWSDQYAHRLQVAGLPGGFDQLITRKQSDKSDAAMSVWYLRESRVIAVEALDSAADFMGGRNLIRSRTAVRAEDLADASRPLPSASPLSAASKLISKP